MIGNAVLIAGPTAGGKSAAALDLARREGRVVVNADSMQVYQGLRILSAAPAPADLSEAPHLLYGHVEPSRAYSVGAWLRDVARLEEQGAFAEQSPVFVGGTGLYFKALCGRLSPMPAIAPEIRDEWRARLAIEGAEALHRQLRSLDPDAAAKLAPTDAQRVSRALEVLAATGRSILYWQEQEGVPLVDPATTRKIVLQPGRELLVRRIDARFEKMLREGALEEARAIGMLRLSPALPAAKAIGLRELLLFDGGEITLLEAARRIKTATRRYAKRQATWFRHQLGAGWRSLAAWPPAR